MTNLGIGSATSSPRKSRTAIPEGQAGRSGCGSAAKAFEERTGIRAPRIVAWEITRSCNLACEHCRASAHRGAYPGELTLSECKHVIDDIASISDPILIITGGEPLLRADIWDIVDYASERGLRPVIGTNGTLIDDACARAIAQHGISRVSVSLDFPDAAGQDAFRGQTGAFQQAIDGMRRLRLHGVDVQVNTTVTKLNAHLLDALHDLAVAEGAVAFHPFLLVPTGRGEDLAGVELTPDECEKVLSWAYRRQKTSPLHFKPTDAPQYQRIVRQLGCNEGCSTFAGASEGKHATRGCLGGITFAFIGHRGDVQPCGYFDMKLGNVREEPFSRIWETSPVFDDLRHFERLRGKCGACEYRAVCGGCRARALAENGDYLAEEPHCAYVPRSYARRLVLDEIQSNFPLEPEPYDVLARRLGLTRNQVLQAVGSLREDGVIRQICASISSRKLGYTSTLCAVRVLGPQQRIDEVADMVSAHPEVTHNYLREPAEYKLWYTAIAASRGHLDRLIDDVRVQTSCEVIDLPVTAMHKIRVDFSGKGETEGNWNVDPSIPFDSADPFDRALIRWAQTDSVEARPFLHAASLIAKETGDVSVDENRVLSRLCELKAQGVIRRFGAFVQHRKLGFAFNGMTAWDVPKGQAHGLGRAFAALPFVSHCYERKRYPEWSYNLYAMVHAKSQEELDAYVTQMREIGCSEPAVLVSTKEYKKSLPIFFEGPLS